MNPREATVGESRGRVLIADDEATFRRATAALLEREGFVCHEAEDGPSALSRITEEHFDVLVADIQMDGNADLELVTRIAESIPDLPTVLITGYPSLRSAIRSVALPVVAYLVKPAPLDQLIEAVDRGVAHHRMCHEIDGSIGRPRASSNVLAGVPPTSAFDGDCGPISEHVASELAGLSDREREIVLALLQGHRVPGIARALHISPHTVRNHLKSVFRKLGVHSQAALVQKLRSG
jgi:DNA-binding NarL/FixJ family response regulator